MAQLIAYRNVDIYQKEHLVLKNVSITADSGQFYYLIGKVGSGKSSLLKTMYAELPVEGTASVLNYNLSEIKEKEIPYLRRTVGVVFQDFRLIEKMTVYENVAFAMRVVGAKERDIKERVPYVLELVGLENKANRHPNEMSGGEQQRLAIARALVNNPSMIIADEPTGNLDPERSFEIMALLQEINNLGTTMLVVTHDHKLAKLFRKRTIVIDEGIIVDDGLGEE
jgi:cell division transport system ATP-binding protein